MTDTNPHQDKAPSSIKPGLSSLTNAINLLKTFTEKEDELGISELALRLGLAKSTVHRMAYTLVQGGLLEKNPANDKYRLGLALFSFGGLVRRRMNVSNEARSVLMDLRSRLNETVLLAVLDDLDSVYVFHFESSHAIRMRSDIGVRHVALSSVEGQLMLAYQDDEIIQRALAQSIVPRSSNSLTDKSLLQQRLVTIRTQGYAIDDQESETGMRGIAAPIFNASGKLVASVGLGGPLHRMGDDIIPQLVAEVMEAASKVSTRMGH